MQGTPSEQIEGTEGEKIEIAESPALKSIEELFFEREQKKVSRNETQDEAQEFFDGIVEKMSKKNIYNATFYFADDRVLSVKRDLCCHEKNLFLLNGIYITPMLDYDTISELVKSKATRME